MDRATRVMVEGGSEYRRRIRSRYLDSCYAITTLGESGCGHECTHARTHHLIPSHTKTCTATKTGNYYHGRLSVIAPSIHNGVIRAIPAVDYTSQLASSPSQVRFWRHVPTLEDFITERNFRIYNLGL